MYSSLSEGMIMLIFVQVCRPVLELEVNTHAYIHTLLQFNFICGCWQNKTYNFQMTFPVQPHVRYIFCIELRSYSY
jgi:hypothetical protein